MAGNIRSRSGVRFPAKKEKTLVIICAAAIFFVLIIIMIFPITNSVKEDEYIKKLEERLVTLENRLGGGELSPERIRKLNVQSSKIESFVNNYNRIDATVKLKTNLLAERLDNMQLQIDNLRKLIAKKNIPVRKKSIFPKARKKVAKNRYHVVKKGDTFYSISRLYGISLEKIRRINGFSEKTVIYPGQKVIIK